MILECSMVVGHGRMAGVAGFGEETEIRELPGLNLLDTRAQSRPCMGLLHAGMQSQGAEYAQVGDSNGQEDNGSAHAHDHSRERRSSGVISSDRSIRVP